MEYENDNYLMSLLVGKSSNRIREIR